MSSPIDTDEVRSALESVLESEDFSASPRMVELLAYIVEQTLAGEKARLKAFTIANEVFGRDETFDAAQDPLVRVQASRLRKSLERYYLTTGKDDPIRISVPKGSYGAEFSAVETVAEHTLAPAADLSQTEPTIAVLPFATIDRDDDQHYFADGITEEITTALTQVENFRVMSRYSTSNYDATGKSANEIGKDLGVRFLMNGTVQRSTKSVRVTASLIDAASGTQVWANAYSRDLNADDLLEVRDAIAKEVAARIADAYGVIPRMLERETRGKKARDLAAYDALLRFFHYQSNLNAKTLDWAKRGLERAVNIDPDYAIAFAALAEIACDEYSLRFDYSKPREDAKQRLIDANDYARRAVSIDPACQLAQYAMSFVHFHRREKDECLAAAMKVIALNPNAPYYVGVAGWLVALVGEWDLGLETLRESFERNPFYPDWFNLAPFQYHFLRGEYDESLAAANKVIIPGLAWDPLCRLLALTRLGRHDEATAAHRQLSEEHPEFRSYARDYISAYVFSSEDTDTFLKTFNDAEDYLS